MKQTMRDIERSFNAFSSFSIKLGVKKIIFSLCILVVFFSASKANGNISVTLSAPSGTIRAPFDISGTITLIPPYNLPIMFNYCLYVDRGDSCMASSEGWAYDIYTDSFDLSQKEFSHGLHTLVLYALDSLGGTSDQKTFFYDRTPSVEIISPIGKVSVPFEIVGKATFIPSSSDRKWLAAYVDGIQLGWQNCNTQECTITLLKSNFASGTHKLKFKAWDFGAITTQETEFTVCDLKVTDFSGSSTIIDASTGGVIGFTGSISNDSGTPIKWDLTVAGVKIAGGNGNSVSATWDGKGPKGKVVEPGTYTATLSTQTVDGTCGDSKSINVKVDTICLLGGDCCKLQVSFGSTASVTSGNLYHSQTLFNIPNSKLMGDFTLSYNSLDSYNGVLGTGWSHSYNIRLSDNGDDSYILTEGDGGRTVLHKNGDNFIPDSSPYPVLTKNADGTYLLTQKSGLTYSFNASGRFTAIEDRNSNAVTFSYDSNNNLTNITDSSGRVITLVYDASKISAIADPSGNTHSFTYTGDTLTGISTFTPDNTTLTWAYTYDANAFMLTKTDPQGYTTTYTYDDNHRAKTSTDPEGKTRSITYPAESTDTTKVTTVTEKDGGVWTYKYDTTQGVLTEKTDPQGGRATYTYDSNRNLTSSTEPGGGTTTYTYDAAGNMTSITDAAGQTTTYAYNNYGQVTTITDSTNKTTAYAYDDKGNLTMVTDPSGISTTYQYDTKGNITSITGPDGLTTAFGYDQGGNLVSITDPTGATTTFTYDNRGNITSQTDSSGNTTAFEYNSLNQLIKITDPSGNSTSNTYDAKGNRTSVTDANGNTTYYEYNYNNQITKVTDALDNVTTYAYGGTGCPSCGGGVDKLTSITDANGNTTSYEYDSLGRLTKETDPEGKIIIYSYDAKGNLISKTDAAGIAVTYVYDTLNRLTNINYPDTNQNVSYTYDNSGKILTMTDQSGITEYAYDTSNRLIAETKAIDGQILITTYNYTLSGSLSSISYPNGRTISYNQDSNGKIINVTSTKDGVTKEVITLIGYNTNGTVSNIVYGNGINTIKGYDAKGALNSLNIGNLKQLSYVRDNVGNITAINDLLDPAKTKTYVYDKLYRLTQATQGTVPPGSGGLSPYSVSYTYDPVGNRQTETTGAGVTNYAYGAGNKLVSSAGVKSFSFDYDNNGNTIAERSTPDAQRSFVYNQNQRLIKAVKTDTNTNTDTILGEYVYNANGQRVKKTVDGKTTYFAYDQSGNLIEEVDGEGKPTSDYIYLGSTPIARFDMNKDNQPPVTTATVGSPVYQSGGTTYVSTSTLITLTAEDEGTPPAGVDYSEYKVDSGEWLRYSSPYTLASNANGTHTVYYRSTDKAGNVEESRSVEVYLDTIPSQSTLTIGSPSFTIGNQIYIGGNTPLTITGLDSASGMSGIEYSVDGENYKQYAGPFALLSYADQAHIIRHRSMDNVFNLETEEEISIVLDKTPPLTAITANDQVIAGVTNVVTSKTKFTFYSIDSGSGIKSIKYRIDSGNWMDYQTGFVLDGAGAHTIAYKAMDNLNNEETEKNITVRLVSIDAEKEISLEPVVLAAAWHLDKEEKDHDNHKHNCKGNDDDREQVLQNLLNILSTSGIAYYIPQNRDDFKETFRSGRHNTYILIDFKDEDIEDEIKETVYYGDGLIFIKTDPDDGSNLDDIFGVKFKGESKEKGLTVKLTQSEISDAGTLQTAAKDKVVRLEIDSANAKPLGYVTDKKETYPVIVENTYGRGKMILFGFDLLRSPEQSKAANILLKAITHVKPSERFVRALDSVPLRLNLTNSQEPVDIRVTETLPDGITADTVTPQTEQTDNLLQWNLLLTPNQKTALSYWLNLPDISGSYQTDTELTYSNNGDFRLYENYGLNLTVEQNSADLLSQIISDLHSLILTNKKDVEKINETIEKLNKIDNSASARKNAERNIENITDAAKKLNKTSVDVSAIRTKLDELLKVWQKKWSLLPDEKGRKHEHEKDKDKKHSWLESYRTAHANDTLLIRGKVAKPILIASTGSIAGLVDAPKTNEVLYFVHTDHLGTPVMMTDKSGTIVWQGEFSPFGEEYSISGNIDNSFGFPGQYHDIETGLYYNWHRYYNPLLGRYSSADPVLHPSNGPPKCAKGSKINIPSFDSLLIKPQHLNPFIYSVGNPLTNIDPTGLACGDKSNDAIIPDSYGFWSFESACTGHDNCYDICKKSKSACDLVFFAEMLNECNTSWTPMLQKPACYLAAGLYYAGVSSKKGYKAYEDAQKTACCKNK